MSLGAVLQSQYLGKIIIVDEFIKVFDSEVSKLF